MRSRRRILAPVLGVAALVVGATSAHAAMTAGASASPTVTTATWGITPAGVNGTGSPSLSWSPLEGTTMAPKFFTIVNTGTTTLIGTTWSALVSRDGSNGNVKTPLRFDACVGAAWNTLLNTCAGTVTTIGTTLEKEGTMSVESTVTASAVGSALSVRAVPTKISTNQDMTAVVTTSVSSATQVHLPDTVTNS